MRNLDRRIDIERKVASLDTAGQPVDEWQKIATRRPAKWVPLRGDERFTSAQFVARQQAEFRIRYSINVAKCNPLDRVICPGATAGSSPGDPGDGEIYDIMEVREIGRKEGLSIFAARRAEISDV